LLKNWRRGLKNPSAREGPLPDKSSLGPLPAVWDLRPFDLLMRDLLVREAARAGRPWLPQPALRAAGAGKSISKSQVVMPAVICCPLQLMLLLLTIRCLCAANMFNLGFPPATAAKVYSPQELTKDLAKYHSSKTYTKKPAEEPDEDEIKPSADYCGGKEGPLSRGECISNLVLGETYRLRPVSHKSTVERARDEDTVAAHLIATAQPSHAATKKNKRPQE